MATTDLAARRLTDGIAGNGRAAWIPMRRGEDGQAVVEPPSCFRRWVFLLLLALQLTQLQQARVLRKYAAFAAARAGIVLNSDPVRMTQARNARGAAGQRPIRRVVTALAKTLLRFQAEDAVSGPLVSSNARVRAQPGGAGLRSLGKAPGPSGDDFDASSRPTEATLPLPAIRGYSS